MNLTKIVRQNILKLNPYSTARDEFSAAEGIFLDANENPYGSYNRYPDPLQIKLKERLSKIKNIDIENIFLGNGSDEIIDIVLRIFCVPRQDKALIFVPTYGMYEVAANINDVALIKIPLNKAFQIDQEKLNPHLDDPSLKVIFICSPNNPTGNLINENSIEFILEHFEGIVVLDEAYIDFCEQASFITKLKQYPNLIIMQTLSKAWGLAGVRLGIAYMSSSILAYFNKIKSPYNISIPNQEVALNKLYNELSLEVHLKYIQAEKKNLIKQLEQSPLVKKIYPSDTNFILVEVVDADNIYEQLIKHSIIIRNRHTVINNCIRITIGKPNENKALINFFNPNSNV